MDHNDEQFESYLREFEPRPPRALPDVLTGGDMQWRRFAAAAAITIALLTSAWFAVKRPAAKHDEVVTKKASAERATEGAFVRLSIVPLTEIAIDDPGRLDAALNTASRRVLPDFRGSDSTLRVLAKE
jgi:hypothetical protein